MYRDKLVEILCDLLEWEDDGTFVTNEMQWLFAIAAVKFDGYRDFQAGSRFLESLVAWLQQFSNVEDRRTAYDLVRHHLIYIGPPELQRLIEMFYPNRIEQWVRKQIAQERHCEPYEVIVSVNHLDDIKPYLRRVLIMGLSDGARIDAIRHSTVGKLSNEQFVLQTQVDKHKWQDLGTDLKNELKNKNAQFSCVYLVDDFMGTGTSFLRFDENKQRWKGRLIRFRTSFEDRGPKGDEECAADLVEKPLKIHVHHYLATAKAALNAKANVQAYCKKNNWAADIELTFGHIIPDQLCFNEDDDDPVKRKIVDLAKRYYNNAIETKHTDVGGSGVQLGYGSCGLPLVLDHNTPNNSLALIWAESGNLDKNGDKAHRMRPLFRRRQRHT